MEKFKTKFRDKLRIFWNGITGGPPDELLEGSLNVIGRKIRKDFGKKNPEGTLNKISGETPGGASEGTLNGIPGRTLDNYSMEIQTEISEETLDESP